MLEASVSSLVRWLELSCSSCRRFEFSIFSTSTCLSSWSYDAAAMLEDPRLTCTKQIRNHHTVVLRYYYSTVLLKAHRAINNMKMFVFSCFNSLTLMSSLESVLSISDRQNLQEDLEAGLQVWKLLKDKPVIGWPSVCTSVVTHEY